MNKWQLLNEHPVPRSQLIKWNRGQYESCKIYPGNHLQCLVQRFLIILQYIYCRVSNGVVIFHSRFRALKIPLIMIALDDVLRSAKCSEQWHSYLPFSDHVPRLKRSSTVNTATPFQSLIQSLEPYHFSAFVIAHHTNTHTPSRTYILPKGIPIETDVLQDWKICLRLPRSGAVGLKWVLLSYPGCLKVSVKMEFKVFYKMVVMWRGLSRKISIM